MVNSRLPGFYELGLIERRNIIEDALGLPRGSLERAFERGGLDVDIADKTIENVIGTYALPVGLVLNLTVNGRDHFAPMVVEEPSVVAAASNACRIVRDAGGFVAEADPSIVAAQIQFDQVVDVQQARSTLIAHESEILDLANRSVPNLVARGGGARSLELRDLGDQWLVVHVLVDCQDAMGANLVNTVAEAVGPRIAALIQGRLGLQIVSNLTDCRLVRVRCAIPASALATDDLSGEEVRDRVARASEFAERDPHRATTHNKGIMNGIDPVAIATGNDWRALEAGAHAFAARSGKYRPLCVWRVDPDGALRGELELPLALGMSSGMRRVHRGAALALEATGVRSAGELAMLAASVGMASNLAALRALTTVGIQKGHMMLHARSIASAAGARGTLVEQIARRLSDRGEFTLEAARSWVRELGSHDDVEAAE